MRLLLAALLLSACSHSRPTPAPAPTRTAAPRPPTEPNQELDHGAFIVSFGGQPMGREDFTITGNGYEQTVTWQTRLSIQGMDIESSGTLVTDGSWRPVRLEETGQALGQKVSATASRIDGLLRLAAAGKEKTEKTPSDVWLSNNVMVHASAFCALAGEAERVFSSFDIELRLAPVVKTTFMRATGDGASLSTTHVDLAGMRFDLVCDGARLIAMRAPLQGIGAAREGWEEILSALSLADRKKPEIPAGLAELPREVRVPADKDEPEAVLACSLLLPDSHRDVKKRGKKGLPAVVFLTGSGAQDRDEDTPGAGGLKLSIFKTLAITLAQAGIASLRCDDRGAASSTGGFTGATVGTFTRDATAMLSVLRGEPAVDPKRTGVVGHSEGAIIALAVAAADSSLAAIALMAGTGRPIDEVILDQIEWKLRADKASDEEIAAALAKQRELYAAVRAGQPLPASFSEAERAQVAAAEAWLRSHLSTDPSALARRVSKKTAVLIAQGDKDIQVLVKDAEKLRDALAAAKVKRVTYKIYGGLNHLFARAKTGTLADYVDPEAQVDAGFIGDLKAFLGKEL